MFLAPDSKILENSYLLSLSILNSAIMFLNTFLATTSNHILLFAALFPWVVVGASRSDSKQQLEALVYEILSVLPPARLSPTETSAKIELASGIIVDPEPGNQYLIEQLNLIKKLHSIQEPSDRLCSDAELFAEFETIVNEKRLQPVTGIGPTGILRAPNAYAYALDRRNELYTTCGRLLDERCKQDSKRIEPDQRHWAISIYNQWTEYANLPSEARRAKGVAMFLENQLTLPKSKKNFNTDEVKKYFEAGFDLLVVKTCNAVVDRLGSFAKEFKEITQGKAKVLVLTSLWIKIETLCKSILSDTRGCLHEAHEMAIKKRSSRFFQ